MEEEKKTKDFISCHYCQRYYLHTKGEPNICPYCKHRKGAE